jgi:amino acid transporter
VSTALTATGCITAMSAVIAVSGGFLSVTLNCDLHWTIPWGILALVLAGLAVFPMIWGIDVFAKLAGLFLGVGTLVLVVISVVVLIKNGRHLSLAPLESTHITSGFSGLAAGFPVAVYRFTGWEDSAALAEEAGDPRRNVPRAVFASIAIVAVSYVVFAYATVTGFGAGGRSGLSTVGASRVAARRRRTHGGRQERQAGRAMTWRHHGGVSDPSKTTDTRMVRQ